MQKHTIAITATFTAEPIEEFLGFWMRELDIRSEIEFAPYNQVFQQLLDPTSLLSTNRDGINVVLVRFGDWEKFENGGEHKAATVWTADDNIERNVRDLLLALKSATERSAVPYLFCLCPAPKATLADSKLTALFQQMEESIVSQLEVMSGIYMVRTAELAGAYPVAMYDDPHADKLGHVPYTQAFFASLGTIIARKIYAIKSAPYKVIALDCDQTLWKGVCGEDGPHGIEIDPPRKALQEFMVAQHRAGTLICLCSKNNEEDVVEVFEQRSEMPLKRDHIVSWRINWGSKSENLKALAKDLKLGLDSFIFIDDDPVPCAEVQANCPEVLTLQLPQDPVRIPEFLKHVWAFDRLKITEEDEKRTSLYKQNAQRERVRKDSLSFDGFLASLGLNVEISEGRPENLERVSQLTQRTNQFNFTTVRRSESEIHALCQAGESECLVVKVSDRFGDYGLVGAIIFRAGIDAIKVDTFLLSCRALGRGVEQQMLAKLGEIAKERGLGHVDVTFIASEKNRPAADFLESIGANFKKAIYSGHSFRFSAESAVKIGHNPGIKEPVAASGYAEQSTSTLSSRNRDGGMQPRTALLNRIATELYSVDKVLEVLESQKLRVRPELAEEYTAPRTPVDDKLAGIWAQVLGISKVGIHDNFFQLGGHSLLGTLLISRVCDAFETNLSLRDLFESPTVAGLAQIIKQGLVDQASPQEIAAALRDLDELSDEDVMALLRTTTIAESKETKRL